MLKTRIGPRFSVNVLAGIHGQGPINRFHLRQMYKGYVKITFPYQYCLSFEKVNPSIMQKVMRKRGFR